MSTSPPSLSTTQLSPTPRTAVPMTASAVSDRLPVVRTRANISNACLACRKRKTKCVGGTPCKRCSTIGTDCVFDQSQDRRRRDYNDRQRAEAEYPKRVLKALLKALKNDSTRDRILEMIQQDASTDELAYQLGISKHHMDEGSSASYEHDGQNSSAGRRSSSLESSDGMDHETEIDSNSTYPASALQHQSGRTAIMNVQHVLGPKSHDEVVSSQYQHTSIPRTSPQHHFQSLPSQQHSLASSSTSLGHIREPTIALPGPPTSLRSLANLSSVQLPEVSSSGVSTSPTMRGPLRQGPESPGDTHRGTLRRLSMISNGDVQMA